MITEKQSINITNLKVKSPLFCKILVSVQPTGLVAAMGKASLAEAQKINFPSPQPPE
jgi:hypothetical protein